MNFEEKIQAELGIDKQCVKNVCDNLALCLVPLKWLNQLCSQNCLPFDFSKFGEPNLDLQLQFFSQDVVSPSSNWISVLVQGIKKSSRKINRLSKSSLRASSSCTDLNYFQLIHYVAETNYRNLWKQAWHKYQTPDSQASSKTTESQCFDTAVRSIIRKLFSCPIIKIGEALNTDSGHCSTPQLSQDCKDAPHPNLARLYCAVESEDVFYLLYEKSVYTLHDCVLFSPAVLETSTTRKLYVVYQLLHLLQSVHNKGLYIGSVTLKNIFLEQNLWLRVFPTLFEDLERSRDACSSLSHNIEQTDAKVELVDGDQQEVRDQKTDIHKDSEVKANMLSFTECWVKGTLSNFDYLIILNKLAGRLKDNPHCHPVMPWITNFAVPEGGWRDLSKSKFRLNKGDKQLDLIYESASLPGNTAAHANVTNILQNSAVIVPHHTSDVLTDITYYVYKARRTSKSVLCKYVRQKWVPAEYPSTIERLQEWTPDECIPEFFSDSSIFYSIHSDLPDLSVPAWCEGPDHFVHWHRAQLESDHVSERLHHWIDLTFGYRLSGSAAMKSKNVCLPLVDSHTTIRNYGMVQLFSHPHPHKMSNSLYFGSSAPKTFRNIVSKAHETKDSGEEETSSESSGKAARWKVLRSKSVPTEADQSKSDTRPENMTIVLPKDYLPLSALRQLESFYTFLAKTQSGKIPEAKSSKLEEATSELQSQSKDMLVLGCLISEICLANHMRLTPLDIGLEDRYNNVCKLLRYHRHQVPKCFLQVLQLLLQLTPSLEPKSALSKDGKYILPSRYPPVSSQGLPPPSPHQLLQPLIHIIPFPVYFSDLYVFLERLNGFSKQLHEAASSEMECCAKKSLINDIAKAKVNYTSETLRSLLPHLKTEGIELVTPYLQEMFEDPHTSLFATWHLFNTVAQCLGPQQSARRLIKPLTKVFDADIPTSKHMKLYHRTFLLQLIVRFGLLNFLAHFMTILIEAVGGLKDFLHDDSEGYQDSTDSTQKRKSSHLQSPELQHMAEESERSLSVTDVEKVIHFDEHLTQVESRFHEQDDEKDPEMFDFDEPSEDSLKATSISEGLSTSSNLTPIIPHDEDNCDEAFDSTTNEHGSVIVTDYDNKDDDDEDPDIIDALASPITEAKKIPKMTAYSRSAPNPTSYLSHYKSKSQSSDAENEPSKKLNDSDISTDTTSSGLSPVIPKKDGNLNISDVSVESVMWLSHRLGPVLTARYLTRNLLRMLSLCYDGPEKKEFISDPPQYLDNKSCISISHIWYSGDHCALKVLDCLSRVAALYGEQFIMLQYFPHIAELLTLCRRRISSALESGLIGAMALLQHIIPYLSDATLMDHLQDVIIKDILFLVVRLISSLKVTFPSGSESRFIVTCRLMDIIYIIGLRIGFEMTRKNLSGILQRFFSCFDKVYEANGSYKNLPDSANGSLQESSPLKEHALEEMRQTFTAEVAYLSYIPFCKLAGGIYMEQTLKNDELIRNLCLHHDLELAEATPSEMDDGNKRGVNGSSSIKSHRRGPSLGQEECFVSGVFGKNVAVVGNRLDVQLGDESHLVAPVGDPLPDPSLSNVPSAIDALKYDISLLRRKMENNQRQLRGNWLAYWEHEKGRSEKDDHFNFKQIKLQSFIGHSGAIRTIQVMDNENSFFTSSKDKTVKLWSLRSYGDGSALTPCQWTYTQHRKSVFAVSFLDSLRLVGSCDSTVHIWDPFMGSCIKQIEPTKGSPITVLASMPAPSTTFLAATTNSTVRFLDARTCRYMQEFKVSVGSTGLIRCLAVSPNGYWLAVGHSTGMISVLDARTGMLTGTWVGHEGEVLQLKAFNNSYFVTSSLDHSMTVWSSEDSHPKCHLKGPVEPVTSLCFYKGEVISGTAGNKVGLHTSIDRRACYSSARLRSDTFKGMLTTMALLPLNRLLLLGSDNGSVVLLS